MTRDRSHIAADNIARVLSDRAAGSPHVPLELVNSIFEYENAVQFDEDRPKALQYIRDLVAGQTDPEESS